MKGYQDRLYHVTLTEHDLSRIIAALGEKGMANNGEDNATLCLWNSFVVLRDSGKAGY